MEAMPEEKQITILVVEDDDNLRSTLIDNLELEGFKILEASTIQAAKENIESADLCILDIMLPDGNGYDFCSWVRCENNTLPILMLTARSLDSDLDQGFESGADDYLAKPYRLTELIHRINALLRRRGNNKPKDNLFTINNFCVNLTSRDIKDDEGNIIHVTKKEFDLLVYLFENRNIALSRDNILHNIWGENTYIDNRTIDNFVATLKKRLDLKEGKHFIRSIRGVGYSLIIED